LVWGPGNQPGAGEILVEVRDTTHRGGGDFTYDAAGNRAAVVHDNKLNLNRTSKVWMFLTRDYSVNNAFVANRYNLNNLPTLLSGGIQLLPLPGKTTIEYSCP